MLQRREMYIYVLVLCLCTFWQVDGVSRSSLDFGWKFQNNALSSCSAAASATFPSSLNGLRCYGLQYAAATTANQCAQACCNQASQCQAWQFCSNSSCNQASPCWIGTYSTCDVWTGAGWIGGSRGGTFVPTAGTPCSISQCLNTTDDSAWRTVNTPHDYIIEGTFDPTADNSHGSLPKSQAWYRRHITIPASAQGKTIWIDFDGVYRNSMVFFNNQYLGTHASGYTSFRFYLPSNQILFGKDNLLSVFVDATASEGWWYEGGGIYRHVWLNIADALHVAPWGVYAPSYVVGPITDVGNGQVTTKAIVKVHTTVVNDYGSYTDFVVTTAVMQGTVMLAQVSSQATMRPSSNITISQNVAIQGTINLWSPNSPSLYSVVTNVYAQCNLNTPTDTINTTIGIRTVVFDTTQGLWLNNRPFKINGVCNHQDFAGVGVAVPERINIFRIQKLKQMGVNGWRMSHNPPNPELLDFLDQYGMVVVDENRNFADWGQYYQDFTDMILRDRNHPSIIMWSVCNEGGCMPGLADGARVGANFKSIAVALDPSRPFGAAMNSDWGVGLSTVLDVQGINYNFDQYSTYHYGHPSQPMFGSETGSCTGARGIYITNATAAHDTINDADYCARVWVTAVETAAWISGGFAWTGFDYKGEPLPYAWPAINSNFGIFDIAGFEKDTFYYYQGVWTTQTVLHLTPQNWNNIWAPNQGVEVFCYSNAPYVEVFLNGKSQGRQAMPQYGRGLWNVSYAPGSLTAVAYNTALTVIATQTVATTGSPSYLKLSADTPTSISANGQDVALLRVTIYDNAGLVVPTANNFVTFSVSGPGTILGVGNGDPSDHMPDKGTTRYAFNGLARVIIQSTTQQGTITVTATSPGLGSSTFTLRTV